MLGFVGGVGGGFDGVGESSNGGDEMSVESEVRGVVMVLMLLLVKGLTAAIFALSNNSVLSIDSRNSSSYLMMLTMVALVPLYNTLA